MFCKILFSPEIIRWFWQFCWNWKSDALVQFHLFPISLILTTWLESLKYIFIFCSKVASLLFHFLCSATNYWPKAAITCWHRSGFLLGHSWPLFIYFRSFQTSIHFSHKKLMWKMIHLVCSTRIQTHGLLDLSLLP